ncbi:hypothetical protein NDU88_005207 [Pleurodeles waltl]|uniref:Uncharacterized protein n=1 Tax=Pleurodeles waltl TaxID=8319 RepID=A0AAV7X0I1_PLEWA|nr:hypothetical protein NDU88_005207 [Pleurodeles waltl]
MVTLVVAPPGLRTEIGFGRGRRGTQADRQVTRVQAAGVGKYPGAGVYSGDYVRWVAVRVLLAAGDWAFTSFVVSRLVPSRGAAMSVAQLHSLDGPVPPQRRRSATGYGIEHSAQAPALAAPDQGGPGHERTQQERPAQPRPKIQWGSSSPPFTRSSLPSSGPGAHQPGHSQAGEQHLRCSSPVGDDPSNRREEARESPPSWLKRPMGGSG